MCSLVKDKVVLLLTIICLKYDVCARKVECGYKQCPPTREGALNVHLIAHSHMDAGWVKTYDQYYFGSKSAISTANVQLIFHSVLSELLHDKRRKFTFSEVSFFWRWWKEQRPATRATFRSLVQEGRVEFAGGGWVQGDEATTDYLMILDQFTWGLRKLNDTLGPCGKPKAAWQIDTYGHTREHVSLLAQMGYDGLFIGRVNYKDRESMLEEERMEFMWRGSDVLGKMSDIMTHTLYNLYNAPDGFCFDFLCNEEPIIDDPDSKVYNADKRVNDFIAQVEHQAKYYEHDNIMVTMGGDFTYQSAANWFMSMDKLINHVNTHPANMSDINIFYSTPSCYLKALYLNGRRDKAIYTEMADHLPYGSDKNTYWTGFYTSRPSIKYLVRKTHIFLQIAKQLTVLARMGDSYELHVLRHAVGLMMHHDSITGTSQQHVANDFVKTLCDAFDACAKKVSSSLSYLTPTWGGSRRSKGNQQFIICHQLNISQCAFVEGQESLILLIYNPQSTKTYHYIRLPAIALHYVIRNSYDEELEYQISPLSPAVTSLPGRTANTNHELVFEAENVPPLGYSSFYITAIKDALGDDYKKIKKTGPDPDLGTDTPQIANEYLKVRISRETGLLESITHVSGAQLLITQNFFYYAQNRGSLQSGAYSFRPDHPPVPIAEKAKYTTVSGPLVKEVHQRFSSWASQTLRLYRGEDYLELDWVIGPVPISTDLGKEVVSIFSSNISNRGEFYTDSNMRQMIKRSCSNDSSGIPKKPVAACYYPVTSRICIEAVNSSIGMCVLTDRAQGGTSYNEGEIELMVHRRLLTDDGFGLDETLNEEEHGLGLVVRGQHRLYLGARKQQGEEFSFKEQASRAAHHWQWEPWVFAASGDKLNRRKWQSMRNKRHSALRVHGLPRHVRVLTLEPWKAGSVLLRLENTLEKNDKKTQTMELPDELPLPTHVNVELKKIFQHLRIKSVRETTLGANQWLEEARQMDWSTRYVYTGGDDGLLTEDVDYVEEEKSAHKESESEADQDTAYKVNEKQRRRANLRQNIYDPRRKRSLNISENYIDNVFYATDIEPKLEVSESSNIDIANEETTVISEDETSTLSESLESTTETKFDKYSIFGTGFNEMEGFKSNVTYNSSEKYVYEYESTKRRISSDFEEDELSRSGQTDERRTIGDRTEANLDETDDGVTKSMYEMYYKKTAVKSKKCLKKIKRPRWQKSWKRSRTKDKESSVPKEELTPRHLPFEPRTHFYESGEEQNGENREEDMELARMRTRRQGAARRKRAPESVSIREDHDFVVTLRPTQIRTFVIRFEVSRQNYVL